jgi:ABC-type transport system involved in multi-copper enzyme maturation permease subunit
MNRRALQIVARFELNEALRSRLALVVLGLYGLGAGLGAYAFGNALADSLRSQVVGGLVANFVEDAALRLELQQIEPLALFYGFMALQLVAPLVLVTSAGAHAGDLARGSARFVLTRSDRGSWAFGKLIGHAMLLATGLSIGALVTILAAFDHWHFDVGSIFWLLRAAFRAWVYGVCHLGIFAALSLVARTPARARVLCVLSLFGLWLAQTLSQAPWVIERVPAAQLLGWLFPARYKLLLWSPSWLISGSATLALLTIGLGSFALGQALFARSDA